MNRIEMIKQALCDLTSTDVASLNSYRPSCKEWILTEEPHCTRVKQLKPF
ncbi:hypothetical protein M5W68_06035 [Paenibacillus larvae]|nr:hypothetical protein [Paenibacillus larvae]MCY9509999.1 hypothetical protein [Paenibacillus larvae]MCY9524726.1 hypothetical protein [Paenibacillus larvae]